MYKLRTLLVDDEGLSRRGLRLRLQQFADVEIIGECVNGREALATVGDLAPDLLFLDVQMPGLDGFDVVRRLQPDAMPMVVFVTAYDHYAVSAFEVNAVDYLLKPIDDQRLVQALSRARQRRRDRSAAAEHQRLLALIPTVTTAKGETRQYPEKIAVKDGGEITLITCADIDWVDAAKDYMCLHVRGAVHVMRITMKELEGQLDPAIFQRIHRSTLVNMRRVEKLCAHNNDEYYLVLDAGERLRMSRRYKERVQRFFYK